MMKVDLQRFKGVFVAMNACYDAAGNIDTDAYRKLARHYQQVGVKGLYLGGSTGEGLLQDVNERKQVAQAVIDEVGDALTVIVHVGAPDTRQSVELAKHAEAVGATAVSAVPSIYYPISEQGVETHWLAIVNATNLPFIMYHIPQTTGFTLSRDLLRRMIQHEQIMGVKISSGSVYELQQFKQIGGEDFLVFNGPDEQYLAGRVMGADGGIGGTYGVMPELYLAIERCLCNGQLDEARVWQYRVNEIINDLFAFPSLYAACKGILAHKGFICGAPRPPIEPLRAAHHDALVSLSNKIDGYVNLTKQ